MKAKIVEQQQAFDDATWDGWSYRSPATNRPAAYAKSVAYLHDAKSLEQLEDRADRESRKAVPTQTRLSLTQKGFYVTMAYRPADGGFERMKFSPPVPLDDAISGDQPPLAGRYPRIVFPAEGRFRYVIGVAVDPKETASCGFGQTEEIHDVTVYRNDSLGTITLDPRIPCNMAVQKAIADFHESRLRTIPAGRYRLQIVVERLPVVSVRIDGGRPLSSELERHYVISKAIRGMIGGLDAATSVAVVEDETAAPSHDAGPRYIEMPAGVPYDNDGRFVFLKKVRLRTGNNRQESAALEYVALRRPESVAENAGNPNVGLVEVQFDRVAVIKSIDITYEPEDVRRPGLLGLDPSEIWQLQDAAAEHFPIYEPRLPGVSGRSGWSPAPAAYVNVGKTVLAEPKKGRAAPTTSMEFEEHLTTFRFGLFNEGT